MRQRRRRHEFSVLVVIGLATTPLGYLLRVGVTEIDIDEVRFRPSACGTYGFGRGDYVHHTELTNNPSCRPLWRAAAGPGGTAEPLIAALEVMFPGSSTVRRRFDVKVIELQPGTGPTEIGHALMRAVEVDHGMPLTLVGLSV